MTEEDSGSEIRRRLWNDTKRLALGHIEEKGVSYEGAVLEQYKLYVEMADRVSARRGLANSFFLSLNTGIVTVIIAFGSLPEEDMVWWLLIPLIAILGQCFAWFYLMRSYQLLNGAKFRVVGALEERLPASPFWQAEWWALGEGRHPGLYWPLSHIEQWIPVLFALVYLAGFIALVLLV